MLTQTREEAREVWQAVRRVLKKRRYRRRADPEELKAENRAAKQRQRDRDRIAKQAAAEACATVDEMRSAA